MESAGSNALQHLRSLYATGFQDPFLDQALYKIVERQIARDETDLARVENELSAFERQYGVSSGKFWRRYRAGQAEDTADFMEWNIFCTMQQRLLTRLGILKSVDSRE